MAYHPNENDDNTVPASLLSDLAEQYLADKAADRTLALKIAEMLMQFAEKMLQAQQAENEARRVERAEIARYERKERGFHF